MDFKERESNFELLRIVLMIIIIMGHFTTGYPNHELTIQSKYVINTIFAYALRQYGAVANNVFFMICGYFAINNNKKSYFKILNIIKMVFLCSYFTIVLGVILFFFGVVDLGFIKDMLKKQLLPISSSHWWFITVYLIICLFSSSLNDIFRDLKKSQILVCISLLYLFWYLGARTLSYPYCLLQGGIFFYLIGMYFGRFFSSYPKRQNLFFLFSFLSLFLFFFIGIILRYCENGESCISKIIFIGLARGVITPVTSIFIFIAFKNLKLKNNSTINGISKGMLGVYILHCSMPIRFIMWNIVGGNGKIFNYGYWIIYTFFFSIIILILCLGVYFALIKIGQNIKIGAK